MKKNHEKSIINQLKYKLIFIILSIIISRIGSFIPIPGINNDIITKLLNQQHGTILDMFNMFSGGALNRASIFALGIMPYVSSSIIMQLLVMINPSLSDLNKAGDEYSKYKINKYTKYSALLLSIIQSFSISIGLHHLYGQSLVLNSNLEFYLISIISLVCGSMFLMWIGEQITEHGMGNGISILIFTSIISSLPISLGKTIEQTRQGELNIFNLILILILIFIITFFVVFIERSQRHITIHYAKSQQNNKIHLYKNHLPLKINMSGVMPAIFASSLVLLPTTLFRWFGNNKNLFWLFKFMIYLQPGALLYMLLYLSSIVFFCFFYITLIFNSKEIAKNLKMSGAFISGIRPGKYTSIYINKIVTRLTIFGALYIIFICLVPEFMRNIMHTPFFFGGTSLLIVILVIIDFISYIQCMLISNKYYQMLNKKM
ncbi:MAG: preprotein translocase subunit SecY [Enterobacterales bacterium]